jgi:hypothetical protein
MTGTLYQLNKLGTHSSGDPAKPFNGLFPTASPDDYVIAMRQIAQSGVCEIEKGGAINGYLRSTHIVDVVEGYGVPIGQTNLRKAVRINVAGTGHGFAFSGRSPYGSTCSGCANAI